MGVYKTFKEIRNKRSTVVSVGDEYQSGLN